MRRLGASRFEAAAGYLPGQDRRGAVPPVRVNDQPTIAQTIAFLQYAQRRGVALALMTGRHTAQRAVTAACVEQRGITGYRYLILRPPAESSLTAAVYKAQRRQILERAGWEIALSIGDQVSDMTGGYADAGFLLPNPMYFIP